MQLRRRRTRPLKKPSTIPDALKRRKPSSGRGGWKNNLLKGLIVFFVIVDVVLIVSAVHQCEKSPVSLPGTTEPQADQRKILQVEVLNGCGVSGVAHKFTDVLRARGVDVVKTDNYKELDVEKFNMPKTLVVDRKGNMLNAVHVADLLGMDSQRVVQEINEALLVDATVIIGQDFRKLRAWQDMEK
ncbi:LytR C-terminal domain-containing protein [bacterium]|nr:LytR C-terminal domain-containing protein [bacterium]